MATLKGIILFRDMTKIIFVSRLVPGAKPVVTPHVPDSVHHYYTREVELAEVGYISNVYLYQL